MNTLSTTHTIFPLRHFIVLILFVIATTIGCTAFSQESYTVSIVPQSSSSAIYNDWQPLLDYLNETLDLKLELELQDSIKNFEVDFLEANPDFLFLNPYHEVMAHKAHGYIPLLSDASRRLKGILVVPKASELTQIEELHNKQVAFPAPNAFGASLYLRAYLDDVGIYINPTYVGTHANAYRHAMLGEAAASGGVYNTLRKESEAFQTALRVLYETPGVTPHPLAVHPRVPEHIREAVVQAVLELTKTEEGRQLLQAVQLKEPMQVTYKEHYQFLENYNLEEFLLDSKSQ